MSTLRAVDRCDTGGCNAAAYVVTLHGADSLPLLWCGHHYAEAALGMSTAPAVDNRQALLARSGVEVTPSGVA